MRYSKIVAEESILFDKKIVEVLNQHKNCCSSCQKQIKDILELLKKNNLKRLKSDLRRRNKIYQQEKQKACEVCGEIHNLHIHHIDEDHTNNNKENLKTLCGNCHVKVHLRK